MSVTLTYGTVALEDLVFLQPRTQEAVYDGPTFLYMREVIHIRGVLNPEATAYEQLVDGTLRKAPGRVAVATEAAIRHKLMQPRQKLILMVGEVIALQSPRLGFTVDAKNGPMPLFVNVTETIGIKTYVIEFIIETFVNECPGSAPPVVLSHRWRAEDVMERERGYLTTRTIHGHALLRTDRMLAAGVIPDDFRAAFFHPVLPNCQRMHVNVVATEDGDAVQYDVVDEERYVNLFAGSGLVDLEVFHTVELGRPHLEDTIVNLYRGGLIGAAFGPVGLVLGAAPAVASAVPKQTHSTIARVWGDRLSKRKNLEKIAIKAAFEPILQHDLSLQIGAVWVQLTHHTTEKMVEVQVRVSQGISDAVLTGSGPNNGHNALRRGGA